MRILVLGGTRFLGRAVVDAAIADGHELTLFNRGRTNPTLYPELERVSGDRAGDLSELTASTWDAVIDVAAYHPAHVLRSTRALRDRVGRYAFVSSVSVYVDQSVPPVEGAAVHGLAPGMEDDDAAETYGGRKAACEEIVVEAFGDRALVVRPGLIVGPHDPTGRFTYWPHRVARGGEVLAPGAPADAVQFIDVRDLGGWIVRSVVAGLAGVFNATGETLRFDALLDECRDVTTSDASFTWVDSEWLLAQGVEEWMGVPLWIASPGWEAANRVDVGRAVANGLAFRPLAETVVGALELAATTDAAGLAPDREAQLLAGWHGRG